MQKQDEVLYSPAEVERQLGVKGSTLRNYAKAYESVFGELYRGSRNERLWPTEALERLDAARSLFQAGKAVSLEAALELLGASDAELSTVLAETNQPDPMMLVLEELRALRQEVNELKAQLALPTPEAAEPAKAPKRPWWRVWR